MVHDLRAGKRWSGLRSRMSLQLYNPGTTPSPCTKALVKRLEHRQRSLEQRLTWYIAIYTPAVAAFRGQTHALRWLLLVAKPISAISNGLLRISCASPAHLNIPWPTPTKSHLGIRVLYSAGKQCCNAQPLLLPARARDQLRREARALDA